MCQSVAYFSVTVKYTEKAMLALVLYSISST